MALSDQQLVTGALNPFFLLFIFCTVNRHFFLFFFKVGVALCNPARGKPTFIVTLFGLLLLFALFGPASGETSGDSGRSEGQRRYTREALLGLCSSSFLYAEKPNVPAEIRRKRRGCRGGRRKRRSYFPSIIMGNVLSITNKMEELATLTRLKEHRECGLMCFTETWLNGHTPDSVVSLSGFTLARADRSAADSGKKTGGGLAVYVSERWCNPANVHVKEQLCTRDLEMLTVALRPYYLPREFSHVIVYCVYIPPSAHAATACERLHSAVSEAQNRHPRALVLISGDFNHASLSAFLPTFTQYVTCHTRGSRTLDLLYGSVKGAYTSAPLPPLGRSDHNLVHLLPHYTPKVRREPAQKEDREGRDGRGK